MLQAFFAANRNQLKDKGIVYPFDSIGGGEAGHYRLSWAVQSEAGIADERFPSDLQSSDEEWDYVLKQCSGSKALISTEGFWDCSKEDMERIKALTSEYTVKIVVYLRRQDHFEDSWYNQLVKDLRCMKTPLGVGMFPVQEKFSQWADIFGRENLIVRPYEKQQFYDGTIFADFVHAVWGLELTDDFALSQENSNPRLHRVALEYRRLVNQLPLSTQQKFMTLTPLLQVSAQLNEQGRSSDPVLPPQERLALIAVYNDFYTEIARDYLERSDGRLFYEPLPDPNEDWQPYDCLLEEDARLINAYLREHHPEAMTTIFGGIDAAEKSDDPSEQEAARRLSPGIVATSAPRTGPFQVKTLHDQAKTMQTKELYIHIGTHKTGTTALQHFFSMNRELLRNKGIEYPSDISGEAGHHRLGWSLHKEGGRPSNKFPADLKSSKEEWSSLLASGGNKVLISSETLYNCNAENMQRIREHTVGFQTKVIVYLRRQDSMTISISNQITKASERKWTDYDKIPYKMNYIDCLDILAKTFGKENIIVRPYEKQQFYGGTIFADFLHYVFGQELTEEFQIPEGDINSRLHPIILEYKRLLNHLPIPFDQLFGTLGPLLELSAKFFEENRPAPLLLSPEKRIEIIHEYDKMNQQIAKDYLGRADGRLFYDPLPDRNEIWEPYQTLKKEHAGLINQYLADKHPEAMSVIVQGIKAAQSCQDETVLEAARLLSPGITLNDEFSENLSKRRTALKSIYNRMPKRLKPIAKEAARKLNIIK